MLAYGQPPNAPDAIVLLKILQLLHFPIWLRCWPEVCQTVTGPPGNSPQIRQTPDTAGGGPLEEWPIFVSHCHVIQATARRFTSLHSRSNVVNLWKTSQR